MGQTKKVAVVLCGCGRADGSEVHESVSCLIHLSMRGVDYRCFAPDAMQPSVVNHVTNEAMHEGRNMMVEASRISRGEITALGKLDANEFDAMVVPGGFGAAKNLCDFASRGAACVVLPEVERAIKAFHAKKKPIGLCCIAPVVAARVLGGKNGGPGVTVTVGNDAAVGSAIAAMGSTSVPCEVTRAWVDSAHKIVTTPAYMCDARPHEVFEGIGEMIERVVALASN